MTRDDRLERRPGRFVVRGREPLEQLRITQPADHPDPEQPLEIPAGLDLVLRSWSSARPVARSASLQTYCPPAGVESISTYGVFPGLTLAASSQSFRCIVPPNYRNAPARYFSVTMGFG